MQVGFTLLLVVLTDVFMNDLNKIAVLFREFCKSHRLVNLSSAETESVCAERNTENLSGHIVDMEFHLDVIFCKFILKAFPVFRLLLCSTDGIIDFVLCLILATKSVTADIYLS